MSVALLAQTAPALMWHDRLPAINAALNGITTILLIVGFVLIKRGKWKAHGIVMLSATFVSALFLLGYLVHKAFHHEMRVAVRFPHLSVAWQNVYLYLILFPHLILAIVMLPFIGKGLWHASRREWRRHRLTNRWTIWIWLYVSVSGVLIYYLLYHLFPQLNGT